MSLIDEIVAHESRLNQLETELVGLELRAVKLRDDLRAQISYMRPVRELSPEAIGDIAMRLATELTVIQEKWAEVANIRKALRK